MKAPELGSTLVAGVLGAVLLFLVGYVVAQNSPTQTSTETNLLAGFAVGAGVQIGVRLLGVS